MLKSDHCGMEIGKILHETSYQEMQLKSDHCGMEILHSSS